MIEVLHPNGLKILRTFDLADREATVSWKVGTGSSTQILNQLTWLPFGGLTKYGRHAIRWVELLRDAGGRITEAKYSNTSSTLESVTYGYAPDGNVLKSPSTVATPNILHDSVSRLKQDRANGGVQTFGYDDAGNRTIRNAGAYTYAAATNDKLTNAESKTFTFDAAGNVTARTPGITSLTIADDGTATAVQTGSGTTTWTRDFRNLRVSKAGAGGSGTYFYSPNGDLTTWVGPSKNTSCGGGTKVITPYENYVYVGSRRVAAVRSQFEDAISGICSDQFVVLDVLSYFADKMDLPRAVYTAAGVKIWSADFDAFGNPIGTINQDPDGNGQTFVNAFRLPGQFAKERFGIDPSTPPFRTPAPRHWIRKLNPISRPTSSTSSSSGGSTSL